MAQLPQWQSLDSGIPVPDGRSPGRVVAVVASKGAVDGGWAGKAALDLARAWSGEGAKVMVVDGALHYPTLHQCAGTDNVEGLSDAALFGLSVGRIARPVDGGSFFLITAGTAVADANSVAGSPRWGALLGGFLEAGVKLLLFVRDGDSGCAAFLGSASDIIVLANEHEKAPDAVRDLEGMVRAVAGPGRTVGGGPGPTVGGSGWEVRSPQEWTASGPGGSRRIALLAAAVVVLVVLLLVAFGVVPLLGASPEPSGSIDGLPAGSVSVVG